MSNSIPNVICAPGGVAPDAWRYAPLGAAVTGRVRFFPEDLEDYREDQPLHVQRFSHVHNFVPARADLLACARRRAPDPLGLAASRLPRRS